MVRYGSIRYGTVRGRTKETKNHDKETTTTDIQCGKASQVNYGHDA